MNAPCARHKKRRRVKVPTPDYLANVALYYLSRFAASEADLRRVLDNRLRRAAMVYPDFAEDKTLQQTLRAAIDSIVEQHKKSGILNDAAFAQMKANALRRAGRSARRITQQLQQRGVEAELVEAALCAADEGNSEESELNAAVALARRRGLGAFRKTGGAKAAGTDQRRKDFATLARAGFSYDTARKVLESER